MPIDATSVHNERSRPIQELQAAKTPTREFKWATRIWAPRRWVVTRTLRGRTERVPTAVSARAAPAATPRSDPGQPVFAARREAVRTSTTRWPAWRLLNVAHR